VAVAPANTTIDAAALREAMSRFGRALEEHREELNSLNVFPVPDGDTGTNMALTQLSVVEALDGLETAGLPDLGRAISRASLMGARGNSGVILAQVLRGLCERLCRDGSADAAALAEALVAAAEEARRAVAEPLEGTALSVLSDAAAGAQHALAKGGEVATVAGAALRSARDSVARTREVLPELREAGVVDAGGLGMLLLFDALASTLAGHDLTERVGPLGPVGRSRGRDPQPLDFGHEVMFLWEGRDDAVAELTRGLSRLGDSVVIVGGGGLYKVHAHVDDPDAAVSVGGEGAVRDVRVVDLAAEVAEHCVAGQARAVRVADEQAAALVAVADGDGLVELFRSLGAVVVSGGPGNKPAVADIVAAIHAAPADCVLVLPNHRDVIPVAEQAASESAKTVLVVPVRTLPAGLSAAAAFNPIAEADENRRSMWGAAEACACGEIALAAEDRDSAAGEIRAGDCIGTVGDEVLAVGHAPPSVAAALVRALLGDGQEILTLVVGTDPSNREAAAVEEAIREAAPALEVDVHRGGQLGNLYLIGVE
jgi:DAK2 domain fusion protein YloV